MNVVILGAPGSGKGTQAELLAKKFGLYYLQTGKIARELAEKDERIAELINNGKLVPEAEMTMYVIDFLKNNKNDMHDILFEGFPRFISQYEALSNFLRLKGDDIDLIISLDISAHRAIERLSSRRICAKCGEVYNLRTRPPAGDCGECGGKLIQRKDDHPTAIKVRFKVYAKNTKKLIDYLDKKGKLFRVNGDDTVENIQDKLVAQVQKIQ